MSSADRPRRVRHALVFAAALVLLTAPTAIAQTYSVTSLADDGAGSLREAIQLANNDGVPSTIGFAAGLAGGTIALASPLPDLYEDGTTIDGDLGSDCVPDIAIDGQWQPNANGINLFSDGNRIAGLAVHSLDCPGCGGDLILIANASSNLIECNYLGTDLSGTAPLGTQTHGVMIVGETTTGNTIRYNRIVYNGVGIAIYDGSSNNSIGPGNELAFGGVGVHLDENDLGGFPDFAALTPDLVQAVATIDFSDDCAGFHQSGGPTLFDGLGHSFTEDFGMRLTGDLTLGAAGDYLFEIPQLDDLARLMVDSVEYLNVYAPGPHSVTVPGLSAGVHSLELDFFEGGGAARLAFTVSGPGAASLSTGTAPPAGCAASQPGLCGELFQRRHPIEGNRITQNSIHDNSGVGITLSCCCSPLANDPGDADLGANTTLNHPEIASVVPIGGGLYSASGSAPPDSTVEVFVSDSDPSGFGEGQQFLATTTADGSGAFSVGLPLELGTSLLTATATDPAGNTSEFGPNYAPTAGSDRVTVGGLSALPGATVVLPVYVRDASLTPLGLDRPAGERIQGIVFKVLFPGGSIATASAARAGVLAGLTPLWELAPVTGGSIAYLGSFSETTNPIPFNLDAAEPGDVVVELTLTLAANAPAGALPLTLDAATTELDNQAGSLVENAGNGALALADGEIFVQSNAASWLWAGAESASSVHLTWADPNANETGFRVERSEDGASWTPVGTAGPDDWQFLDTAGLAPATFYLYRLVTLIPQGDSQISNVAPTTTHALQAAKVCSSRLSAPRSRVRFPAVAWSGDGWGTVAQVYDGDQQGDLYFQRLNSADLAPVGPAVRLTATDAASQYPTLRWNGSHYGLLWYENLRGEPEVPDSRTMFALLDADGNKLRGDVPLPLPYGGWLNSTLDGALVWDGTNWGIFNSEWSNPPHSHVVYYRLSEEGDTVLGPVDITTTGSAQEYEIAAAFSPSASQYGVAWVRYLDTAVEVWFQRVEESNGALQGGPALLGSYTGYNDGLAVVWNPASPPDGAWMVVWSEYPIEEDEAPLMLRMVAANGSVLGTGPVRLSDDLIDPDDPPFDEMPVAALGPDGELRVFAWRYRNDTGAYEIGLVRADAAGARLGTRIDVTPSDALHSTYPRVASDGSRQAVVFNDGGTTATQEIAAVLVDAAGSPGPLVALSSGNSYGNSWTNVNPGTSSVAAVGEGFVTVWTDTAPSGHNEAFGRIVDGSGQTLLTGPFLGTLVRGVSVVSAQGGFALAYKDISNRVLFARFDGLGGTLVADAEISTGAGGAAGVGIDFDGEAYGLLYTKSGTFHFRRVSPDGTPLGAEIPGLTAVGATAPRLHWIGGGWAAVFARGGVLRYGSLDVAGNAAGETTVTGPPVASNRSQFHSAFSGYQTAIVWNENLGLTPPGTAIHFAIVGRGSEIIAGPAPLFDTDLSESQPRVAWQGDSFHVFVTGGLGSIRELAVQPDGTILGEVRRWTNRGTANDVAWNGATTLLAWNQGETFQETLACVADASPPPCPTLSAASLNDQVRLSWDPVGDAESGIFRYDLYRDGRMIAENYASSTQFDDGGYTVGFTHVYQVRALNGAFDESDACPTLAFSTTTGDANGDGLLDPADVFYLVNFLLADGPPPLGDADANGDGAVTVTDIFYLINYHFAGGPPPVPITGGGVIQASAPATRAVAADAELEPAAAPAPQLRSRLVLGSTTAAPGTTVRIPIDLVDRPGTPLGPERPFGDRVQALALAVACAPCDGIAALTLEPAGPLARFEPRFESRPTRPGHAALVTAYDELDAPLFTGLASSKLRTRVATLVVQLAPDAPLGATLDLRLDPGTTLLSNQAGTTYESVPNGWLELADGRLTVGATKPNLGRP